VGKLLTVNDVLTLLPWKRRTLYRHLREGTFVTPARIGGKLAFDGGEVRAWIAARFAERPAQGQSVAEGTRK